MASPQSGEELNFFACLHGLKCVTDILRKFLSPIITATHTALVQKYGSSICPGVHKAIDKRRQTFKERCTLAGGCDVSRWLPDLLNDHKGKVFDGNVKPDDLPNNHWQVGLLYMDRGHGDQTSAELTDVAGLVNVCFNCMPVYLTLMTPPDAIPLVEQIRLRRNELKHNDQMTLSSQQKVQMFGDLISFAQHPLFSGGTDITAQILEQLRDSKVFHGSLDAMLSELLSPDGSQVQSLPALLQNTEEYLQAILHSSRHGQEIQKNAKRTFQLVKTALDCTTDKLGAVEARIESIGELLDVLELRDQLKAAYRKQLKHHRLISSAFCHLDMPLNDIFVDLEVEKDEAKRHRGVKSTLQAPKKIIDKLEDVLPGDHLEEADSTSQEADNQLGESPGSHCSCIIFGAAGTGKSVLTQMLTLRYAEADQIPSKLSSYSLCFYCKAKDLTRVPGDTVHQRVLKLLQVKNMSGEKLKKALSAAGKTLTIIDGLDEVSGHEDIKSLISECLADNSSPGVTLVTSRPEAWDMKEFSRILTNKGFGRPKIYKLITNFFKILGHEKHINKVTKLIKKNRKLRDMCAAPLLLTIICILVNEEYLTDATSKTKIYQKLIDFVHKRLQTDRGVKKNIAIKQFELLYKAAYFCLVNDHTYSVEKTPALVQYMGEDNLDELIAALPGIGLFTPEVYFSVEDVEEKCSFTFCHKTFAEFCAANYLCSMNEVDLITSVQKIIGKSEQFEELLTLTWGIATHRQPSALPHLAAGVLQFIQRTAQYELAAPSAPILQLDIGRYNRFCPTMTHYLRDADALCRPPAETVAQLHAALSMMVSWEQLKARGVSLMDQDWQGWAVLAQWVVQAYTPHIQRLRLPCMTDAAYMSVGGALTHMTALTYLNLDVHNHNDLRAVCGTTDHPHTPPALTEFTLMGYDAVRPARADGCLGALVCAAAPTLTDLFLDNINLGESVAGVGRWLKRAVHVRTLTLITCRVTAAVFERHVAPAVRSRKQPLEKLRIRYEAAPGDSDHWDRIRELLSGAAQKLIIIEDDAGTAIASIPMVDAIVTDDYEADDDDDASFKYSKGSCIKVWGRPLTDRSLYEVEQGGRRGQIPTEYVTLLQKVQVVAAADYEADRQARLSFMDGELLTLRISDRENSWFWAENQDGMRGGIPINYITKPRLVPISCKEAASNLGLQARALCTYTAQRDDKLSFSKGDIIQITDTSSKKCWYSAKRQGQAGFVSKKDVAIESMLQARALCNYAARGKDELSCSKGDMLEIVDFSADDTWFIAQLQGKQGLIPKVYVKVESVISLSCQEVASDLPLQARALCTYTAQRDNRLTFSKGDMIQITDRSSKKHWYSAELQGQEGFVPKKYVAIESKLQARALHNYTAQRKDELVFLEEDVLQIIDFSANTRWFIGQLQGKQGLIPKNYVKVESTLNSVAEPAPVKSSDEAPDCQQSSKAQQPSTVAQQPPTAAQQPPTAAQQPPTAAQQPSTSAQQPPTAAQQPPNAAQQPPTAAQQPPTAVQQSSTAAQQHSTAAQQPSTAAKQPSTAAQQPSTAAQQPSTAAQQPSTAAQQPSNAAQQSPTPCYLS